MAYEAEMITYSQKIFYYLLCHGALSDLDAGVNDLYRAYVEHEDLPLPYSITGVLICTARMWNMKRS